LFIQVFWKHIYFSKDFDYDSLNTKNILSMGV